MYIYIYIRIYIYTHTNAYTYVHIGFALLVLCIHCLAIIDDFQPWRLRRVLFEQQHQQQAYNCVSERVFVEVYFVCVQVNQ